MTILMSSFILIYIDSSFDFLNDLYVFRQTWANNVHLDQTPQNLLSKISIYIVWYSFDSFKFLDKYGKGLR